MERIMKKLLCLVALLLSQFIRGNLLTVENEESKIPSYQVSNIVQLFMQSEMPSRLATTDPEKFRQLTGLDPQALSPNILQDLDNQYDATRSNTMFHG